jgi:hypothetical protein
VYGALVCHDIADLLSSDDQQGMATIMPCKRKEVVSMHPVAAAKVKYGIWEDCEALEE